MLNTIFRNLVSNAIKFSNQQGSINIISTFDDKFIEISVKDDGIGMSKETIESLFDNEKINSRIGTTNEQGSGLGLFLCKDFVEKHGGKNVSSISKKTTFVLAGDNIGPSKKEKAEDLGIPIISEEEFINKMKVPMNVGMEKPWL